MSARGVHHSTTALGPQPGVLSLRPVAATPEPRTKRGSCSSRLEKSEPLAAGQAGACGEGLRVELHLTCVCTAPRSGAFRSGDRPSLQIPFPQDRSWEIRHPCASTLARLCTCTCSRSLLRTRSRAGGGREGRLSASGLLAGISLFYNSLKCLT